METKVVPVSETTDEVQLWNEGQMLGTGAWTKPYDLDVAVQAILQVAMGRYANA